MKFVIVGYGRVGMRTARILHEEGHEVVVVDVDPDKVERATTDGFEAYQGNGSNEEVLEQTDLESADAIAALSGDLNVNFAACMVGKHYGCRTVMRIDDDYREEIYHKYADDVDEVIYPERLGAAGAKTALLGGNFNVVADLAERLQMLSITIPEDSPAVGLRLSEIDLPSGVNIYAHGPAGEPMSIPLPRTTIEAGDRVAVITEQDGLEAIKRALLEPA